MINVDVEGLYPEYLEALNQFPEASDNEVSLSSCENVESGLYTVAVAVCEKPYSYEFPFHKTNALIDKRIKKRCIKLALYKALSSYYCRSLPWGSLTGIRPTKLCYMNVEMGGDYRKFLIDDMLVSSEKAELAIEIINSQKPFINTNENDFDLFVNIPFCPTRCAYCSFLSNEIGKEKHVNEYIEGLIREIEFSKRFIKNLRSVYIGGGTPVSISAEKLNEVLAAIGRQNVEYTVEAGRPDSITAEKLAVLKKWGVTRVCVNPQTFCDKTLRLIGRAHTASDVIEKFELAKSFGFDVNMDLIAGLPEEDFDVFRASLDKTISLNPENITVHTLAVKRGSKISESVKHIDVADIDKMLNYSNAALQSASYKPYYLYRLKNTAGNMENTGYAKKGKACVYNIDMMEEVTNIVACGANAVSKRLFKAQDRIERYGAPKDILTYINKVETILTDKNKLFD